MQKAGRGAICAIAAGLLSACTVTTAPGAQPKTCACAHPAQAKPEVRKKWVSDDADRIEKKFEEEKASLDQAGTDTGKGELEMALREADRLLKVGKVKPLPGTWEEQTAKEGDSLKIDEKAKPTSGSIDSFECRATICKGKSSHQNAEAFRAFSRAAFASGRYRYRGWFFVASIEPSNLKPDERQVTLFYVGKEPPLTPKPTPAREVRP
jgi:hypothetical protein